MPAIQIRNATNAPHKIGVIGVRGIGNLQGGIERFCSSFYSKLPPEQFDITIFVRQPDLLNNLPSHVRTYYVRAPQKSAFQTIVHSVVSVLIARRQGIKTLHVHGLAACLVLPLASTLGMRTIVRHVGPDYHRRQWGRIAKALLRVGERSAARHAESVVCLNPQIAEHFLRMTGRSSRVFVLPNGVDPPPDDLPTLILERLALVETRYVLAVGRLVSDKNFDVLIQAFLRAELPADVKLVIVGSMDREPSFFRSLLKASAAESRVVLPGAVYGMELWSLYHHAGLFVLPSAYEGMSFSLLEAAISGVKIVASEISANSHVCSEYARLVEVNSIAALSEALSSELARDRKENEITNQINLCKTRHDWYGVVRSMIPILLPSERARSQIVCHQ
jgi:glycosyltransferase involved in cell wall biosynthesis